MSAGGGGGGQNDVTVRVGFFGTADALNQMNVIGKAANAFGSKVVSGLAGTFGAAAAGAAAFMKVNAAIQKNIQTAKQVSQLAIKFNMDPSQVHAVKLAADDAGVSVRALLMSSKALAKAAEQGSGSKAMAENWKQLGFSAEKVAEIQARPMQFLPEIAQALAQIGDENERAAAGAMLFGRGYQQIVPLLDDLGKSEEAREKFLRNQNAMTNEQIELNRETARIQSEMEESFERLVASGSKMVNWAKQYATYLQSALGFLVQMVQENDKINKGKETEAKGQALYKVSEYSSAMNLRNLSRKERVAKGEKLTPEEEEEEAMIKKFGSVEGYVSKLTQLAYSSDKQRDRLKKEYGISDKEYEKFTARMGKDLLKDEGVKTALAEASGTLQVKGEAVKAGREKVEMDKEGNLFTVRSGINGPERVAYRTGLEGKARDLTKQGQDQYTAAYARVAAHGEGYMSGLAGITGQKYDSKTGKFYSDEEYAKLEADRKAGKTTSGALTFEDQRAKEKEAKEKKRLAQQLARAKRNEREPYMTPVEKAELAAQNAAEDLEVADDNLQEKKNEVTVNNTRIEAIRTAAETFEENKRRAANAIKFRESKQGGVPLGEEEKQDVYRKFGVTAEDSKKMEALVASISGMQKQNEAAQKEMVRLEIKKSEEVNKQASAIDGLAKAKESEWAKEKQRQKDLQKDAKDFQREEFNRKMKNARLAGASELEIKEHQFQYEMGEYADAAKEREALEAEILEKQQQRIEEADGDLKAGEMTDQEEAAIKAAREKQDVARNKTSDALFALADEKPMQAAVSDLGKLGGGRAVQYGGNNPADLIRKSNDWLQIIAKNTGAGDIEKANIAFSRTMGIAAPTPSKVP